MRRKTTMIDEPNTIPGPNGTFSIPPDAAEPSKRPRSRKHVTASKTKLLNSAVIPPKPAAPLDAETAEIAKHLPLTVGSSDEVDEYAVDQAHLEDFLQEDEGPAEVVCARPPKGVYFTVLAETGKPYRNRGVYYLLELEGSDPFLVSPAVAEKRREEDTLRPVLIVRYVTMAGVEGLWALKIDPPDGKANAWNKSAMTALKVAEEGNWIRLISARAKGKGGGCYRHVISPKKFAQTPPRFSSRTFKDLRESAFSEEQRVNSDDHEAWKILDEGSEK
jgi:hypothetical protein